MPFLSKRDANFGKLRRPLGMISMLITEDIGRNEEVHHSDSPARKALGYSAFGPLLERTMERHNDDDNGNDAAA